MDRALFFVDLSSLPMPRRSLREDIVVNGLALVHEKGLHASSVRDIVEAAGAPSGSFTNHFGSKEAFALEILEIFFSKNRDLMQATLYQDNGSPLRRLKSYFDRLVPTEDEGRPRYGCLLGNSGIETSNTHEQIRVRIAEYFQEWQNGIEYCIAAAMHAGEISPGDATELAAYLVAGIEGALLRSRIEKSAAPLKLFKKVVFARVLR